MAAGLRVTRKTLELTENGTRQPGPALAARYLRVLRGLANHDAVNRELTRGQEAA